MSSNSVYSDDQQVYVGNINEDLTETELRIYFSHFGKVIDVKSKLDLETIWKD